MEWLLALPESDLRQFAEDLRVTPMEELGTLLVQWRHTAEVHADPELYTALTRPVEE